MQYSIGSCNTEHSNYQTLKIKYPDHLTSFNTRGSAVAEGSCNMLCRQLKSLPAAQLYEHSPFERSEVGWVQVSHLNPHRIRHFWDVLSSQSLVSTKEIKPTTNTGTEWQKK